MNDIASRLARHQAAEHRANRRDFDGRYGTHKRKPYGTVQPSAYRKKRQISKLIDDLMIVGALAVFCLAVLLTASN